MRRGCKICQTTAETQTSRVKNRRTNASACTAAQQEEEEVATEELGDEWALSKQHPGQPVGKLGGRKCVWSVCEGGDGVRRKC